MVMGEPDASGRARPIPVPGSEFGVTAGSVVSAIGQAVDLEALKGSGLTFTPMGIEVDASTLATSLEGVFAGGDGVTGADLAVRAVAAGKLAAVSISQFLEGRTVRGDPEMVTVLMGRLTEEETAELFREIEASPRARMPEMPIEERIRSFDEVELGLPADVVLRESGRCIGCGCWKSTTCQLRQYATEYGADPLRFEGARRHFRRDGSHPEIIYEPGKCILCGACVAAAAQAGERLGLAIVGRGFEATVAVPLRGTLAEGMPFAARRAAEVCPTGAIALKDSHGGGCPMA
jgi:formate dehydrogenase major subunit